MDAERQMIRSARALLAVLCRGRKRRDGTAIAMAVNYVSYDGGEVTAAALRDGVRFGHLVEKYPGQGLHFWRSQRERRNAR
jgi:hypothetical protein